METAESHSGSGARQGEAASDPGALIDELLLLRAAMLDHAVRLAPRLAQVAPGRSESAVNLAHFLALRRFDIRPLQARLARIGLSSLGRSEANVLASVDRVIGILHRLDGRHWTPPLTLAADPPADPQRGGELLARHAQALFGDPPVGRGVRIMVTLPTEAASDDALVEGLVAAGMDVARINCAHDSAAAWSAMAERVRKAARRVGRPVKVLMDLAGPKLRTGPVAPGPAVLKLKPSRDAFGGVTAPWRLGLRAIGSTTVVPGAAAHLGVNLDWLRQLQAGDRIAVTDARTAHRKFTVVACHGDAVLAEGLRTTYLTVETRLRCRRRGHADRETRVGDLPARPGQIRLRRGQRLRLVARGLGHDAIDGSDLAAAQPATMACTLPEVFAQIRTGDPIWFDDGRIGGVVRHRSATAVEVDITHARDGGESLAADKGINLPETSLKLPALTAKDLADLTVAARTADIVGLSFAQSADDVWSVRKHLVELGAPQLGLILKIETRRGFEHLPEMLFAAMGNPAAGVMIARGDLAVECGYERLAEVQEEMLWACEAAHMPVVWATQVLETLARTGLPSRAEITDAAMGERAECVMLNKGPHILDAMRTLDDILHRMQAHQSKKRPLLRALKAWHGPAEMIGHESGAVRRRKVKHPRLAGQTLPRTRQ